MGKPMRKSKAGRERKWKQTASGSEIMEGRQAGRHAASARCRNQPACLVDDQNDSYNCRIDDHFLERGAKEYQDVHKLSAIADTEDK